MAGSDDSAYEVTVHGTQPGPGVVDAARRGLERVKAPPGTSVVFTDTFAHDVGQATGNPSYKADRGGGVVGAICVPQPDDSSQVFVNTPESIRFDQGEMERLLAHEGGHALLHSRNEALREPYDGLFDHDWQWTMALLGGVSGEEYRIEAALRGLDYGPPDIAIGVDHLEANLAWLNLEFVETVIDPNTTPRTMADRITQAQGTLTNGLAYLAAFAEHPGVTIPGALSASGARHWQDYVGPVWDERKKVYSAVPDALQPFKKSEYEAHLRDMYTLEMKQLGRIGFERIGSDATEHFNRIATVSRCEERLRAAS